MEGFTGEAPTCTWVGETTPWQEPNPEEDNMFANMGLAEHSVLGPNDEWSEAAGFPEGCDDTIKLPDAPEHGNSHNGIKIPDMCFKKMGPHYIHVIGDWGGTMTPSGPKPASQRVKGTELIGVDDRAQLRVAEQIRERAKTRPPDYFLNVGDNFYWQGLEVQCGSAPANQILSTGQFQWNYEAVYTGEGVDGKPWFSVLGNHDYGGYIYNKGWDQQIAYSWSPNGRWLMPAQFWRLKVHYPGFSVDYFFLDTNDVEAIDPHSDPDHNICSMEHVDNSEEAGCGVEGPKDVWDCQGWFGRLWAEEAPWFEEHLSASVADWQIVVTHFPPVWKNNFWNRMAKQYGIDLMVVGHMHKQVFYGDSDDNPIWPTPWVVSGGGGGITSEAYPDADGYDDQYGFFELAITKEEMEVTAISHGGIIRSRNFIKPVGPRAPEDEESHRINIIAKK